ncbi:PGN_0703 family putative restriction endonuclease [Pseudotabrizicola algicola]|uniref:Restriction endonuclease n=1 Tax=Pseudotabrizicola algicola TaxID=2709381 RepID=A0A6B3RHV4_9RHOB|nr:hypothetical protein [Pseudotabrizicola algicola]NEX44826.1 hypothetical protein [Pseudotabrizicola algicola]
MPDFLPDLPEARILEALQRAPGNELRSGKFDAAESSAALVANAFGWFLERPAALPPLPGVPAGAVQAVELEMEMRFPWSGGRHPWLDVGVVTHTTLVGIESKRYEPFRPAKQTGFSDVYDRPVWGPNMARYTAMAQALIAGEAEYRCLDAAQLVKHAYGIRTRAEKRAVGSVLVYLYAEPAVWASGKPVDAARKAQHRAEVARFAAVVAGDEVVFVPLCWGDLLRQWEAEPALRAHVAAIRARFGDLG